MKKIGKVDAVVVVGVLEILGVESLIVVGVRGREVGQI